jgi:hypothetical protein
VRLGGILQIVRQQFAVFLQRRPADRRVRQDRLVPAVFQRSILRRARRWASSRSRRFWILLKAYVYDIMIDQPWSIGISCAVGAGGVGTVNNGSTITLNPAQGAPIQPLNPKTTILVGPTVLSVRAYDARN